MLLVIRLNYCYILAIGNNVKWYVNLQGIHLHHLSVLDVGICWKTFIFNVSICLYNKSRLICIILFTVQYLTTFFFKWNFVINNFLIMLHCVWCNDSIWLAFSPFKAIFWPTVSWWKTGSFLWSHRELRAYLPYLLCLWLGCQGKSLNLIFLLHLMTSAHVNGHCPSSFFATINHLLSRPLSKQRFTLTGLKGHFVSCYWWLLTHFVFFKFRCLSP